MFDPFDLIPLTGSEWDRFWRADWDEINSWSYGTTNKVCCKPKHCVWHPGIGLVCCLCRKLFTR